MLHLVGCLYYLYQWCTVKQMSDNEIYLLIIYIKSILWRVAKCLSYIQDARCLKVKAKIQYIIIYNNIISVMCSICAIFNRLDILQVMPSDWERKLASIYDAALASICRVTVTRQPCQIALPFVSTHCQRSLYYIAEISGYVPVFWVSV